MAVGLGTTTTTSHASTDSTDAKNKRKFSRKSTATEAQYERIDRMLSTGEKSTFDFRRAGIMAPAARIKEMNDKLGYYIPTIALRDIYDDEGFLHKRVGVYELIDRPQKAQPAVAILGAA
jgi:hypothetical protein